MSGTDEIVADTAAEKKHKLKLSRLATIVAGIVAVLGSLAPIIESRMETKRKTAQLNSAAKIKPFVDACSSQIETIDIELQAVKGLVADLDSKNSELRGRMTGYDTIISILTGRQPMAASVTVQMEEYDAALRIRPPVKMKRMALQPIEDM